MKKYIYLLNIIVVTLVFPNIVLAKENSSLPIIVLNDANKEPFTTENNDGFLNVLLDEAFKRVGFKLQIVKLPAERGLINANQGLVDGEVNRIGGIEKKYTNLRRIPEKLRDSDFCALSKKANIINTPEELSKHVVGYIKGWKIYEKMMMKSNNTIIVNDPQQLFRLLKINRLDVILYACLQSKIIAKKLGIEGMVVLQPELKQRAMFLYLNKKHEALVPRLNKALKEIKNEGLYDKYYKEKITSFREQL